MARTHRAPSRAQILRGNRSRAGRPIWNGRIDSGRKLAGAGPASGRGGGLGSGDPGLRSGVTMVPAWPRAWM
jgi:hypothetical protein